METPRRSLALASSAFAGAGASVDAATGLSASSRFPGLVGGAPASSSSSSSPFDGGGRLTPAARTDDELAFERWKDTVRAQDEEAALLHQTVVSSKRQQIEVQHERLAKQRAFIRHEKRKLLLQNALLDSEKERFEASLASDWFCLSAFPTVHDRRLTLDVGGQLFEISAPIALKDAGSLLAALVADDSPLGPLECGCFRVDRDWWLFRYVLHFLRDGLLPQDPKLLRELYLESEFWKLESMRKAIEMKNMELLQLKQQHDAKTAAAAAAVLASAPTTASGNAAHAKFHLDSALLSRMKSGAMLPAAGASRDPQAWWLDPPTWWGTSANDKKDGGKPSVASVAAALKRAQLEEQEKAAGKDADHWWRSSTYKGRDFAQSLVSGDRKKAEDDGSGTPRSPLLLHSTWPSAK
ncbi:hypothetical protein PINS_up018377 [Pythium insidiosum]|nr:hypothetical protein PINS_up018377 [Pythium insidiosum]